MVQRYQHFLHTQILSRLYAQYTDDSSFISPAYTQSSSLYYQAKYCWELPLYPCTVGEIPIKIIIIIK